MSLTARQERLYNHRVDLYRPATAIVAGKPGPTVYTLEYADVPCRLNIKNSPGSPTPMGRVEADIVIAIDQCAFAEDQEIDDGWFLHNKTLRPDGTPSTLYDRWWIVRGEPQRFIDSDRRHGGRNVVMLSQEPRPVIGLPA